jgi:glycosyltransferase involved in cell wall biosynthesis
MRSIPVVWDSVDSISLLFRQAMVGSQSPLSRGMTRFELGRTERYEGWLLSQFERVLVTSPNDRQALLDLLPPGRPEPCIEVLRNGVDLAYFTQDGSARREPSTLVVSGKMSYHANVTMALHLIQDIMPCVWAARPEVRVEIVGKDPPKAIQDLAQDPRVVVTGTVGDLRPYLRKATVAVAPVAYGVGIQNKVLEAMACKAPVVASSQAVSALQVQPGENVIVAQGVDDFAGAILKLLSDPYLREKVGQSGRRYVEEHHDWSVVAARLEQIYAQALN